MIFIYSFYGLCAICAGLYFYTKAKVVTSDDANFKVLQRTYLCVYLLAVAGDWLQGPHVYALYESYGMSKHQIEILFIAGFGSSMIFGTFVGSVADKYGRRNNCFIYGVLYGLACITKHFGDFWILMVGRLFGGIATSILFSAFESWLVYEHNDRKLGEDLLSTIFSHATLGNSLVAIIAGISAQFAADAFGFVAPFDMALTILIVMNIVLVLTWRENHGDSKAHVTKSFVDGFNAIKNDRKIMCIGLIQSLFEGSMYVFVLEWTPALTNAVETKTIDGHRGIIPHGYIFASFMLAVMIGSSIFKLLTKYFRIESFMRFIFLIAAAVLYLPVLFPTNQAVVFGGFVVFEMTVGIFWPAIMTMRGIYVPESARATIMNFFRIPLNIIVVMILLQNLKIHIIFCCCVAFLTFAALMQHWLYSYYADLDVDDDDTCSTVTEEAERWVTGYLCTGRVMDPKMDDMDWWMKHGKEYGAFWPILAACANFKASTTTVANNSPQHGAKGPPPTFNDEGISSDVNEGGAEVAQTHPSDDTEMLLKA